MRLIDIAVFMMIFYVIGNFVIYNYGTLFGFKEIELLKLDVKGVGNINEQTAILWQNVQNVASSAILLGTLSAVFVTAIFGQYYLSIMLAVAGIVINFIPFLRNFFSALPVTLYLIGIPSGFTLLIVTLYNLLLMLFLLMWMSGRW